MHMRPLLALAATAAAGVLLAGCQDETMHGPDAQEQYTRDFIKNFGVFDSRHDWNMATRATVTVATPTPTDVRIYADAEGRRYLFGTFLNVSGRTELGVDVPKGTDRLVVKAAGRTYTVSPGDVVEIGTPTSRIVAGDPLLEWSKTPHRMFTTMAVNEFMNLYPEGEPNLGNGTSSFYFVSDGKPHTFYPIYWNTDKHHALGIYYLDPQSPADIVMEDLYFTKTGDLTYGSGNINPEYRPRRYEAGDTHMYGCSQDRLADWQAIGVFPGLTPTPRIANASSTDHFSEWRDAEGRLLFPNGEAANIAYTPETAILKTANGYISRIKAHIGNWGYTLTETVTSAYNSTFECEAQGFQPANSGNGESYYAGTTYISATGITYTLPAGVVYGFYLKCGHDADRFYTPGTGADGTPVLTPLPPARQGYEFTVFSQGTRNQSWIDPWGKDQRQSDIRTKGWNYTSPTWWDSDRFTQLDNFSYAAWGKVEADGKTYAMFSFEDWEASNPSSRADLNDVMFIFESGQEPVHIMDEDDPEQEDPGTETPFLWIVGCEDLGDNDFDFNDVVFGFSDLVYDAATQQTTVKITALAAGGTLPIYLLYDGARIIPAGNTAGGEFHSWFDGGRYSSSTVINAGDYHSTGASVTVRVRNGWTLAYYEGGEHSNMGGFTVEVNNGNKWNTIEPPTLDGLNHGIGAAPQMICVPASWYWPTERTHISNPYPRFVEWCRDRNNDDWHTTRYTDNVVRHDFNGRSAR